MRKLFTFLVILLLPPILFSQKVYYTSHRSQADVTFFVADSRNGADLAVYLTSHKEEASGEKGIWYVTKYSSQSEVRVCSTRYKSQADLSVYFVKQKSQAGWINKSKKYLFP